MIDLTCIPTNSSPHICRPMYGGQCFCSPRSRYAIALDVTVARNGTLQEARDLVAFLMPQKVNVVQFPLRAAARRVG